MAKHANKNGNLLVIIIIALVVLGAGVYFMQKQNDKGNETSVERAADELGNGIDNAADELRGNEHKSTGEKIGDAVKDTGQDIKDAAHGE